MKQDKAGLLGNLLVVDVSSVIAGSYASLLLSEFGARVIKVEHPRIGDGARNLGTRDETRGLWWKFLARNKESVTCDLSTAEGSDLIKRLAAKADVFIENFRPGTLEKWGLGYEALAQANAGLVMLRISGFGQDGPYRSHPGYGTVVEAISGIAHLTGETDGPPMLPSIPLADAVTGITGFGACMTALWARDRPGGTGKGTIIDASLYAPILYLLGAHFVEASETGASPSRRGNQQSNVPRNAIRCADGKWLAYSAQSFKVARGLVDMLGLGDDARFDHPACAYLYGEELNRKTVAHLEVKDRASAIAELRSRGVPVGPINDLVEVINDAHMTARAEFTPTPDRSRPDRPVVMPTAPVRIAGSPRREGFTGSALGQDTDAVLGELLGLNEAELARLRGSKVI